MGARTVCRYIENDIERTLRIEEKICLRLMIIYGDKDYRAAAEKINK